MRQGTAAGRPAARHRLRRPAPPRRRPGGPPRPAGQLQLPRSVRRLRRRERGRLFGAALPSVGGEHAPAERRTHLLDVVGAVQDGQLVFSWLYSADTYREETVRGLAERFAAELAAFAEHCARPGAGGCTPRTSRWSPSARPRWTGSPGTAARSRTSTR
ncbi:hypothetical protein ACFQVA_17420 [Actinomadura keratinilytica]